MERKVESYWQDMETMGRADGEYANALAMALATPSDEDQVTHFLVDEYKRTRSVGR